MSDTVELTPQQLRDEAARYRRTASRVRVDHDRWEELAADLEAIARRQEARANELAGASS